MSDAVTVPQQRLCERENISLALLTSLFAEGEVDGLVVGSRYRHVIEQSWRDYVERQRTGRQRDPVEKKAAAEAYRASLVPALSAAAKRAYQGKVRPGRARGSRNKPRHHIVYETPRASVSAKEFNRT